jgi:FKBP-type peptidyl-prolyl cis-trans isomerase SlyD
VNVKIAENKFVAIDYRLTLESGEEFDRSPDGSPLGFVTGTGSIIPGLEQALAGKRVGDSFQVTVEPEAGYGPVQKELLQAIPVIASPPTWKSRPACRFMPADPAVLLR